MYALVFMDSQVIGYSHVVPKCHRAILSLGCRLHESDAVWDILRSHLILKETIKQNSSPHSLKLNLLTPYTLPFLVNSDILKKAPHRLPALPHNPPLSPPQGSLETSYLEAIQGAYYQIQWPFLWVIPHTHSWLFHRRWRKLLRHFPKSGSWWL